MSFISEIRELEGKHIVIGVIAFLAIVAPGFLIIFRYHPELVEKYDIVKLSVFSAALTTPVFFLNFAIVAVTHIGPAGKFRQKEGLLLAAFGSVAMLYMALVATYVWALPFARFAKLVSELSIPFAIFAFVAQKDEKPDQPSEPTRTGPDMAHH